MSSNGVHPTDSFGKANADSQATTDTSSIGSFSSYCSECPICNPPDESPARSSPYGTFTAPPHNNIQPPEHSFLEHSFLEASIEACSQICCGICDIDSPPPSIQSSECSSTPYPSSLSSNSAFDVEISHFQDQTTDAAATQTQSILRHNEGYKMQETMRSTNDESNETQP